jgi:hypothetical protein
MRPRRVLKLLLRKFELNWTNDCAVTKAKKTRLESEPVEQ